MDIGRKVSSIKKLANNDKRYSEKAEKRRSILNTLAGTSARQSQIFHAKRNKNEGSKQDLYPGKELKSNDVQKHFRELQEIKDRVNTTVNEYEEESKWPISNTDEQLMCDVEEHLFDISDDMMRINISLLLNKFRKLQWGQTNGVIPSKEIVREDNDLLSSIKEWFQDAMDEMGDDHDVVKTTFTSLQHSSAVKKDMDRIELDIRKIAYLKSKVQLNKLRGSSTLHLETTMAVLQKQVEYALLHEATSSIEIDDDEITPEDKSRYLYTATDEIVELMKISRSEGYKESEQFRCKMKNYFRKIAKKDEDIGILHYKLLLQRKTTIKLKKDLMNLQKRDDRLQEEMLLHKSHFNREVAKQIFKEKKFQEAEYFEKTKAAKNEALQRMETHNETSKLEDLVECMPIIPVGIHLNVKSKSNATTTNSFKRDAKSKRKNSAKTPTKTPDTTKQEDPTLPEQDTVPKLNPDMENLLEQMYKNFMDEQNKETRQMRNDLLNANKKLARLENKDGISSYTETTTGYILEDESISDTNKEKLNRMDHKGMEEINKSEVRLALCPIDTVSEDSKEVNNVATMLCDIEENRIEYNAEVKGEVKWTYNRGTNTPTSYEENITNLQKLISDLWEKNKALQTLLREAKHHQVQQEDELGEKTDRIQEIAPNKTISQPPTQPDNKDIAAMERIGQSEDELTEEGLGEKTDRIQEIDQELTLIQLPPNSPRNPTPHQQMISDDSDTISLQAPNKTISQRPTQPDNKDIAAMERIGQSEDELREEGLGEETYRMQETDQELTPIQPPNSPTPQRQKVRKMSDPNVPNKKSSKLSRQGSRKSNSRPYKGEQAEVEAWLHRKKSQNEDPISAVWAENSNVNIKCKSTNEFTARRSHEKEITKSQNQLVEKNTNGSKFKFRKDSRSSQKRKSLGGLNIDNRQRKSDNSDHANFPTKSDVTYANVKKWSSYSEQTSYVRQVESEPIMDVDVAVLSLYENELLDVGKIQSILLKKGYLVKDKSNKVHVKKLDSDSNLPWLQSIFGDKKLIAEVLQANQTDRIQENTEDRQARSLSEESNKHVSPDETKEEEEGTSAKFDPNATITAMKMLQGAEPEQLKETATTTIATLCVELEDVLENVSGFFTHAQDVLAEQTCLMSKANDVLAQSTNIQKEEKISSRRKALEEAHYGSQFGETTRKRLRGVETKIVGAIGDFMQACTNEVDEELQAYVTIRGILGSKNIEQGQRRSCKSFDRAQDDMEDWVQNLRYRSQRERRQFWEKRKWLKTVQKHSKQTKEGWTAASKYRSMNFFQVEPMEETHHSTEQQIISNSSKYKWAHSKSLPNDANEQHQNRNHQDKNDREITSWEFLKVSSNRPKAVNLSYNQNNDELKKRYGKVDWLSAEAYSRRSSGPNEASNRKAYPIKNRPQCSPESSFMTIKLGSIRSIYRDRSIFAKPITNDQSLPAI